MVAILFGYKDFPLYVRAGKSQPFGMVFAGCVTTLKSVKLCLNCVPELKNKTTYIAVSA